jgi:CDP-diacylglycerol pyrophosphatase
MRSRSTASRLAVAVVTGCVALGAVAPAQADPNALWTIVDGQCVPDQRAHADPAPCALVDLAAGDRGGYAVLKDLVGATQFLLIPTARITGIESPELVAPGAPNYFAAAWRARVFVEQRAGEPLPRDWVSLAVNSEAGRSQDQLHVHIDCVRADVRDALQRHIGALGPGWAPFPEPLAGHGYLAATVAGDDLDGVNPVAVLADGVPGARADMGLQTLVVVGAYLGDGRPGFVLLTDRADAARGDRASGEELQDHDACPPPANRWVK